MQLSNGHSPKRISVAILGQKNMMNQHANTTSLNSINSLYMFTHPLRCGLHSSLIINSQLLAHS